MSQKPKKISNDFIKMEKALRAGMIVVLADFGDGQITFGGAFNNDTDVALTYSSEHDIRLPAIMCIKGTYPYSPPNHL